MANQYLMAVDAGTGSVRAVLFNERGEQLGCVQREWTHAEDPRYPGSMDFDWKHNWALASECIRGVLAQTDVDPAAIAAVSTTCMREGIVLYDEAGEEIWACANAVSYTHLDVYKRQCPPRPPRKGVGAANAATRSLVGLPMKN